MGKAGGAKWKSMSPAVSTIVSYESNLKSKFGNLNFDVTSPLSFM